MSWTASRTAADHRADGPRSVQRRTEVGGPADDRVGVHVHRLLRRHRQHQRIALTHEAELPAPAEDAVEQAAAAHPRALHRLDVVRQRGVEAEDVAAVDREQVAGLDVDDEHVLRLLREPGLALPAHLHQRQPSPVTARFSIPPTPCPFRSNCSASPVGDHRPLARQHLAVDHVPDRLGVLNTHARRDRGLDHVLTREKITLHAGIVAGGIPSDKAGDGEADGSAAHGFEKRSSFLPPRKPAQRPGGHVMVGARPETERIHGDSASDRECHARRPVTMATAPCRKSGSNVGRGAREAVRLPFTHSLARSIRWRGVRGVPTRSRHGWRAGAA